MKANYSLLPLFLDALLFSFSEGRSPPSQRIDLKGSITGAVSRRKTPLLCDRCPMTVRGSHGKNAAWPLGPFLPRRDFLSEDEDGMTGCRLSSPLCKPGFFSFGVCVDALSRPFSRLVFPLFSLQLGFPFLCKKARSDPRLCHLLADLFLRFYLLVDKLDPFSPL